MTIAHWSLTTDHWPILKQMAIFTCINIHSNINWHMYTIKGTHTQNTHTYIKTHTYMFMNTHKTHKYICNHDTAYVQLFRICIHTNTIQNIHTRTLVRRTVYIVHCTSYSVRRTLKTQIHTHKYTHKHKNSYIFIHIHT